MSFNSLAIIIKISKPHICVGRILFLSSLDVSCNFLGRLARAMFVKTAHMIGNNTARSKKFAANKCAADMRRLMGCKSRMRIEALFACIAIKSSGRFFFCFGVGRRKNRTKNTGTYKRTIRLIAQDGVRRRKVR